jgi:hypothetical protein
MPDPSTPSSDGDDLLAELQSFAGSEASVLDEIDELLTRLLDAAAAQPDPVFNTDAIWARVEHQMWGR